MASKKISQLTPVTPLLTDLVPLDRPTTGAGAPVTGHATLADIQALIDTGGGGGGGANEYWESVVVGEIFATGTLVSLTGSLRSQFLSSSNGLVVTGTAKFATGLSGSLTQLTDGRSYLVAGTNVTITSASDGQVTISSSGGSGGDEYWFSESLGVIETSGSIEVTGSISTGGTGNTVSGQWSAVFGSNNIGTGNSVLVHGGGNTASSNSAHAEGGFTTASGFNSHSEGISTTASGNGSHAEGDSSTASGESSHAEGAHTISDGLSSHAEGWGSATHLRGFTVVYVDSDGVDPAHAVFQLDPVYGDITADIQNATNITTFMVTDGDTAGGFIGDRRVYDFVGTNYEVIPNTTWITCSNPYGMNPQSPFPYAGSIIASLAPLQWQLSNFTTPPDQAITGTISHAEGIESISIGSGSHAEGYRTLAIGVSKDIQFNNDLTAQTFGAHAEGIGSIAYGNYSHAEGDNSIALGNGSHSEGNQSFASGSYSHAEGVGTYALGDSSHSEGNGTKALGFVSHAEGDYTTASGDYSHAEGASITEGAQLIAAGYASHAEGEGTAAVGHASHAEGRETIASGSYQHVQGKFNLRNNDFSLFVIGDGTGDDNASRSDIVRVNSGTLPGSGSFEVTGTIRSTLGFSGSLTQLIDGTPYLIAGSGINLSTGSSGAVTIASSIHLTFNESVTGASPAIIGSVYLNAGSTIQASSRAMIGGSLAGETCNLEIRRFTGGAILASFYPPAGTLQDVAVSGGPIAVSNTDWYDLYLSESAGGTALAKGIKLDF